MLTLASASGNVFAFLWAADAPTDFDGPAWARRLCPRGTGLGLDGLVFMETFRPGEPWVLEHWDPDGGRTFCSNGTRAAAALLPRQVEGELAAWSSGEVVLLRRSSTEVDLKLPEGPAYGLQPPPEGLPGPGIYGWTGTPHLVIEQKAIDQVDFQRMAPPLRHHPALSEGANVSLLEVLAPGKARIRSWERGVEGETLCCGQGCAVAGAWLSHRTGRPDWELMPAGGEPVRVRAELGDGGRWTALWLGGPVRVLGRLEPGPGLLP